MAKREATRREERERVATGWTPANLPGLVLWAAQNDAGQLVTLYDRGVVVNSPKPVEA